MALILVVSNVTKHSKPLATHIRLDDCVVIRCLSSIASLKTVHLLFEVAYFDCSVNAI